MSEYGMQFTIEARAAYDALSEERRTRLDRAVRILARDPFRKHATARFGTDGHRRRTYPAPGVMLEYRVVGTDVLVVALETDDEFTYLIDETDSR